MIQFTGFPFIAELFRYSWFNEYMLLAKTYRSLSRPLSALEPSHPLAGVTLPTLLLLLLRYKTLAEIASYATINIKNPSP